MSQKLISHNLDLKRIENDGLDLEIKNVHLLIHGVPYVNSKKEILFGTLISKLELSGEKTVQPVGDHVVHFIGEHPCYKDGSKLIAIQNTSNITDLGNGLIINHTFSSRLPDRKYTDYHEKMSQYVKILLHEAQAVDPKVKPKSPRVRESDVSHGVFYYPDTNSTRAEIGAISAKLQKLKVAIVGLGGTGSYVLDFIAKTHVSEIHLFDSDLFLNHNAFRAPGAPTLEKLDTKPRKVAYFSELYSQMRKLIIPHDYFITQETISELVGMDFVFVCIDTPASRKLIIEKLVEARVPFLDVGLGINMVEGALTGSARVTICPTNKYDHIERRVPFSEVGENEYSSNIQIAELNALNAALAVIKWKKLYGFYHDFEKEHNSSYSINVNKIVNDEIVS